MKLDKFIISVALLALFIGISLFHDEALSYSPETSSEPMVQSAVQPDTTGKYNLIQMVRERGWVRVIVTYNMEHSPERYLNGGQRHAQRQKIAQMHDALVHELQTERFNVRIGRRIETYPVIGLTLDEEALRYLYESKYVKRIEIERGGQRF